MRSLVGQCLFCFLLWFSSGERCSVFCFVGLFSVVFCVWELVFVSFTRRGWGGSSINWRGLLAGAVLRGSRTVRVGSPRPVCPIHFRPLSV